MARRTEPAVLAAVSAAVMALLVGGCGPGEEAPRDLNTRDAGSVAVAYADDLFNGRSDQAEKLVDPTALRAYRVLAKTIVPRTTQAKNLHAGPVHINGPRAKVTILGTLCSAGGAGATNTALTCRTSDDPAAPTPGFEVSLVREGSDWFVYYPS